MKTINSILVLMLSIFLMQSCTSDDLLNSGNKDKESEEETAPVLPDMSSLILPFSSFENIDTSGRSVATYKNAIFAATNLFAWQTGVTLIMAVPVATFAEAFNHDPTYEGDGVWQWAYTVNDNGVIFHCALQAKIINQDDVQFDMFVTKVGAYSNVNFYTGIISDDGETGNWIIRTEPNNLKDALGIDYGTSSTGVASLKYTNLDVDSTDEGDYIEYRFTPNAEFDSAYDVYQAEEDYLLEIQWSETELKGRTKSEKFFNDSDWHCWNAVYEDVDC